MSDGVLGAVVGGQAADFTASVNHLDEMPVVVTAEDASGTPLTVNIDGFAFAYSVIMASERGDASGVPKMMADMARGDSRAVVAALLALQSPPESACALSIMTAFLDDPTKPVDQTCAAQTTLTFTTG